MWAAQFMRFKLRKANLNYAVEDELVPPKLCLAVFGANQPGCLALT